VDVHGCGGTQRTIRRIQLPVRIAQLVEQLTLNQRTLVDSNGHPRTDFRLSKISWQSLYAHM
jgi:hypothetical protein